MIVFVSNSILFLLVFAMKVVVVAFLAVWSVVVVNWWCGGGGIVGIGCKCGCNCGRALDKL